MNNSFIFVTAAQIVYKQYVDDVLLDSPNNLLENHEAEISYFLFLLILA